MQSLNATGFVWSPPVSWNCRCNLRSVDVFELKERGLLVNGRVKPFFPAGFNPNPPDPKFRSGRTDNKVYLRGFKTEELIHPLEIYGQIKSI